MKNNKIILFIYFFFSTAFYSIGQNNQSLSLDDCVRLAINKNNNLKRSNLEIQKNAIYHQQAQSSVYPNVNANFSPNLNLGRSLDPYSNQFIDRNIFSTNLSISSTMTLFNGFQIRNAINQTEINQEISSLSYESIKNKLIMDIYQAYLRILLTKEGIKLGQKQIKMLNEQIEIVKAQISANVLTDLDLLNIKTQLSLDELNILNAQNDLNLAFANLRQLLYLPNSTPIDIKDIDLKFMENYGQESVQSIFSRILRRHPDIKMASLKEEIIKQNIEQIKYLKYPTIGLSVGLNSIYSSASPKEIFTSDGKKPFTLFREGEQYVKVNGKNEKVWEPINIPSGKYESFGFFNQLNLNKYFVIGLNVRMPIFNGFQQKYKFMLAEIDRKSFDLEKQNTIIQLQNSVEQMVEKINLSKRKYQILSQKLGTSKTNFSVVLEKFKLGYATSNDFLNAKNALERMESELFQTQLEVFFNEKMIDLYSFR